MTNDELINDIRENFEILAAGRNADVRPAINSIVRSVNRIKVTDKKTGLLLAKTAAGLAAQESAESGFFELNAPASLTPRYSESFFTSVNILKHELMELLSKLPA